MGEAAVNATPAEMIGKPRRAGPSDQRLQTFQVFPIERLRGAEVHRHAMLDNPVLFEDAVQHRQGSPAVNHVIL
jgi:hypothetical protein